MASNNYVEPVQGQKVLICKRTEDGVITTSAVISKVTPHFFDCANLRFRKAGGGNVIGFLFSKICTSNPDLWVEINQVYIERGEETIE